MGYSFQRYENYKKVDNLAFDELPVEWTLKKVKHLFTIGRGRVISQEELDDNGVFPVYSSQTQNNGCLGFINTYDFDCKQITWTTDGANAGTVFLREGKHNCTNVCGTLQPISKNLNFSFYLYSLQYVTQFHKRPDTNGAKIMNGEMAAISLCIPSDYEQQKIANFLDHETAKIDTLITKQEKLIELLKEKRQAVISHAVTKGLNPQAPMKDSGVEWLGEVPEHWVVTRFKFLCDNIIAGPFGSSITKDMYVKSGFKVYGQEQVIPNNFSIGDYFISADDYLSLARYKVSTGDVLISCVGTFGKVAVFPPSAQAGIINPRLIKAKIHKDNSPYFIREYLKSVTVAKQFDQFSRGGTMGVINIAILNEIVSTKPPYVEQCEIYDFIKAKKSKFSLLLDRCQKQIALLKERKTALISAAVTGKINVRDWKPQGA